MQWEQWRNNSDALVAGPIPVDRLPVGQWLQLRLGTSWALSPTPCVRGWFPRRSGSVLTCLAGCSWFRTSQAVVIGVVHPTTRPGVSVGYRIAE